MKTEEARKLAVGTWVKVRWDDLPEGEWWLVQEKLRKNSHNKYTRMYQPLKGEIRAINHEQFIESRDLLVCPSM